MKALAFSVMAASVAFAAEGTPPLRFSRTVETAPLAKEELVAVTLDSDAYAATQDGFPDVHVLDDKGAEVSFVLEKVTETKAETVRRTWRTGDVSLKPDETGGVEIQAKLGKDDPSADGITLVTPLTNFQNQVSVFGSRDGQNWEPLVSDALVFDYSRYMDVRNHEVPLPDNTFRQFRIVIADVTAEQESELLELTRKLRGEDEAEREEKVAIERRPFRIDRIEFWHNDVRKQVKGDKKAQYPLTGLQVTQNEDEQQTVVEVETRREPLTALVVETPSRNFSRRAVVQVKQVRGVRTEWREIGDATITRLDFGEIKREQLGVPFSESRNEQYRLVIENRDSPPLDVAGIHGEGIVYRLVFLAAPGVGYRLFYGSETAELPKYDTAVLRESLSRDYQPIAATLGEQVAVEAGGPAEFSWRAIVNNPLALGGLVVLLVVLLVFGLYAASRRVDKLPKS